MHPPLCHVFYIVTYNQSVSEGHLQIVYTKKSTVDIKTLFQGHALPQEAMTTLKQKYDKVYFIQSKSNLSQNLFLTIVNAQGKSTKTCQVEINTFSCTRSSNLQNSKILIQKLRLHRYTE